MRWALYLFSAALALACSAQAPETAEHFLRSRNILITPTALEAALDSPDQAVRGAAAIQLETIEGGSALPALRAALNREPYLGDRMGIARALTVLGDPRGKETMRTVCLDNTVRDDLRVNAAIDLVPEIGASCILALARIAGTPSSLSVYYALQVLAQEAPEKAIEFGREPALIATFTKTLRSDEAIVRQEAAKCIGIYDPPGAKAELQAALKRESDAPTRTVMSNTLKALQHPLPH